MFNLSLKTLTRKSFINHSIAELLSGLRIAQFLNPFIKTSLIKMISKRSLFHKKSVSEKYDKNISYTIYKIIFFTLEIISFRTFSNKTTK